MTIQTILNYLEYYTLLGYTSEEAVFFLKQLHAA